MAKVTASSTELAALIKEVSRTLDTSFKASISPADSPDRSVDISSRVRETMVTTLVVGHGGRIRYGDPARVSLAGITSTSTMGVVGAARNWCTAARNRLLTGGAQ